MVEEHHEVETFTGTIYVGTYVNKEYRHIPIPDLLDVCADFADEVGFCVSFTETKFIYTGGWEPGVIVKCIHYPRFPKEKEELQNQVLRLAHRLKRAAHQKRLSIEFTDKTIMLGPID